MRVSRLVRWGNIAVAFALLFGLVACESTTEPRQVSYIAIVALVDDPSSIGPSARVQYNIREVSGTIPLDTVIRASPFDTVIVQVEPATYSVVMEGFPSYCTLRYGARQDLYVAPGTNTTIARYFAACSPLLTIRTFTDGLQVDNDFVYRLTGPSGSAELATIGANDTLRKEQLAAGIYSIELDHVSGNCTVVSDGGRRQSVEVDSAGGATADFRVVCSDPATQPQLTRFRGSYHDGAAAFVIEARDPDRNIERYNWDLTDCSGKSVLPGGARLRRGLSSGRTAGSDTVTIVAAFALGLADSVVAGRCMSIRVIDEQGNTTPVFEQPVVESGQRPVSTTFNAKLEGTSLLRTTVTATDPDNDLVGIFGEALLRDGVLGPPDGSPDLGIYNAAGYVELVLPDVVLGSRIQYYDVYSVTIYLIDGNGNFTRLVDSDIYF